MPPRPKSASIPDPRVLPGPGWAPAVRRQLEALMRRGEGKGLAAVFDFDNTLVRGDVGEAVLATLVRQGRLTARRLPAAPSPSFRRADGERVTPAIPPDLTEYYEQLLAPTVHGAADPAPLATGYVWATAAMEGLRVSEVVSATEEAFSAAVPGAVGRIEVTPGRTSYPAPVPYGEMLDLIAGLIRGGFSVWVVSASNVWSVRWMVARVLNPLLSLRGAKRGIPLEQVIGVSLLLADTRGRLFKDTCLVREAPDYASLVPRVAGRFRLTGVLHHPVPTYSGKVACLWDNLGCRPWLAAGDSPGDLPMLSFAENGLWLARLDKPKYQDAFRALAERRPETRWMVQPVSSFGTTA